MVAVMIPPTITTAKGRCVSDPMPWDTAAGRSPRPAINAVIMISSGLLGLLLLWPNTERARLMGDAAAQPKFA